VSITASPPGFVPILKDRPHCWCDRLEQRFAHQGLIDGSSAIDRRGHVDLAKTLVCHDGSVGVEIREDWFLELKRHDSGTVGAGVRIQQMNTGVTGLFLGSYGGAWWGGKRDGPRRLS